MILATGSKPLMPGIRGIDAPNVVAAEDILYGKKDVLPGPVVVCGGGEAGVTYTDVQENSVTVPAATVVSAFGYKAYNPLQETTEKLCAEVYTVGSAVKAGNAMMAIKEGYEAALKL